MAPGGAVLLSTCFSSGDFLTCPKIPHWFSLGNERSWDASTSTSIIPGWRPTEPSPLEEQCHRTATTRDTTLFSFSFLFFLLPFLAGHLKNKTGLVSAGSPQGRFPEISQCHIEQRSVSKWEHESLQDQFTCRCPLTGNRPSTRFRISRTRIQSLEQFQRI